MARTIGSDGERTEAALRDAALRLIARHGYDAVSMRRLADEVGVQAAALYRYFPTKEDLLFTLMREHMEALVASWAELSAVEGDPAAQLASFVRNHIAFHLARRSSTHVNNLELRSLSPERLRRIVALRETYEKELRAILQRGVDARVFDVEDAALVAMAIIQMITGVIVWFRPDERLSIEDVTELYLTMTLRLAGANKS
ncbi:TetR/AcrR family transcriptional regulator [Aliihoeflea sp. 40Bstr573]|uniref:TetR/AcrR family transcriptional regulator n=1 Tax=Aliihoeflea sp. 40Bstr573 TaxID=2696467 RepID=UPI002094C54E|nr:TetR/AcrR family transcriptional regulator [Aliihoeflea sp. 40Bstr573]MCO6388594.1 TetR family transcriptional regulator [Aliihoeflea sp. 40Bstr573]